jgi:diguanylate cyclase (GGDEF)-like protein/PAS domain S-box-containing protein
MKPAHILIVEDEFILASDLRLRLRDLGYAVTGTAATGADALALVDYRHPDLVLMDIRLRGPMDGIAAALEIRRRWRVPVVFLTAHGDDDTLQRANLAEPFGYILKPFEDRELRTLIEIALYKHRAEEEIRRLSDLYATLSQINQAIVRIGMRQELFDEICRIIVQYAGFQLAWIGWLDPQTQQVRPVAQAGAAVGYLDEIVVYADDRPEGGGPTGLCLREGQPCVFHDILNDPRAAPWRTAVRRYGLRSAAALPIRFQGALCAALMVYATTPDVFQAQEMDLLKEAASDISFALDHLETERQRQHGEEQLRESEARFRLAADATRDAFILIEGEQSCIAWWNPAAETIFGYCREEMIGRSLHDYLTPTALREAAREGMAHFSSTGQGALIGQTLELVALRKGGEEIPIELTLSAVRLGDGWGAVGIARDITERKRAEEALRHSEARLQSIFRAVPVGVGLVQNRRILEANETLCRMTGYTHEDLIGQNARLLYLNDRDYEWVGQEKYRQIAERGTGTVEVRWRRKDGEIIWVILSSTPLDGQNLAKGVTFSALDITDRKRTEEALRRSEEQHRAVIETSPDGFWITDREGRLLEVNEAYARLSGYRCDELCALNVADLDVNENPAAVAAHLEKVIRESSGLFQTQHRNKHGRVWQAEATVAYWPIAGGRFFSFIRDIHLRQRAEALLKARMHLSELALTSSLDDLLQAALDTAERFTGSQIGFFHFVDPDQENLTLQAWSTNTLRHRCTAEGKGLHYPISAAGVWVECVAQRQPVIHNDYPSLARKKGLPEGHAPVIRELTVPVIRNDSVVAIIGVGNKLVDYTADDTEMVRDLASMVMDVVDRKRIEERIAHLAYHDALTQLPNRVLLADRLRQAMAQIQREPKRLAVCYLDLDDFKPINDLWGHDQGDRILVEIAQRLQNCVRAGDTVARLGGDEFVVLLGDLTDVEECEHALDRMMTALQAPFAVAGQHWSLAASIGVTLYPDDESDADALLRHGDQAMYAAKQAGGHRYHWFDADHDRRARTYRELLQRVETGLAAGEFRLYYQPKMDIRTGAVIGAEALIRWEHPDEGLLSPIRFMPAVETSSLAIAVDRWVMGEALRQMSVWAAQGLRLPVSVNVSGRHLQQPDFVAGLRAVLESYPTVPPNWLELEILETAALDDVAAISRLIEECRQLGVRFALDDFGTGYSSLTYLKHLPVQVLKIDQSFVRDLLVDADARAIVEGVIGLSVAFRREVIAEGVETDAHSHRLIELGCDLAQGYGIARPMPAEQIPAWVAGRREAYSDSRPDHANGSNGR